MQTQSYTIPSHKVPGTYYTVRVHANRGTSCTCPDATYRRRQCKHGRQVIAEAIPPQPVALPTKRSAELTDAYERARLARAFNDAMGRW